ncbi:MAG: hypothetical protein FJ276_24380 [Planctomycetes bacterium]|nr:hypothetical protein [Planctomycetota bacterium]
MFRTRSRGGQRSASGVRRWTFGVGRSASGVRRSAFDVGRSAFSVRRCVLFLETRVSAHPC